MSLKINLTTEQLKAQRLSWSDWEVRALLGAAAAILATVAFVALMVAGR